jgi:hypothetical protein
METSEVDKLMEATHGQVEQELDEVSTSCGVTLPWQSWGPPRPVPVAAPLAVLTFPKGNGPRYTRTPITHGPVALIITALCPVGWLALMHLAASHVWALTPASCARAGGFTSVRPRHGIRAAST